MSKAMHYQTSIALTEQENATAERLRAKGYKLVAIFRLGLAMLAEKEQIT